MLSHLISSHFLINVYDYDENVFKLPKFMFQNLYFHSTLMCIWYIH